jgi:hypothetical protein
MGSTNHCHQAAAFLYCLGRRAPGILQRAELYHVALEHHSSRHSASTLILRFAIGSEQVNECSERWLVWQRTATSVPAEKRACRTL